MRGSDSVCSALLAVVENAGWPYIAEPDLESAYADCRLVECNAVQFADYLDSA